MSPKAAAAAGVAVVLLLALALNLGVGREGDPDEAGWPRRLRSVLGGATPAVRADDLDGPCRQGARLVVAAGRTCDLQVRGSRAEVRRATPVLVAGAAARLTVTAAGRMDAVVDLERPGAAGPVEVDVLSRDARLAVACRGTTACTVELR